MVCWSRTSTDFALSPSVACLIRSDVIFPTALPLVRCDGRFDISYNLEHAFQSTDEIGLPFVSENTFGGPVSALIADSRRPAGFHLFRILLHL